MRMKLLVISSLAMGLAACANLQKEVYGGAAALSFLESAALVYASWPDCAGATTKLCSTQEIKDKIAKADQVAYDAVKAAEAKVNDPNATKDAVQGAVNAAEIALAGLSAYVPVEARNQVAQ